MYNYNIISFCFKTFSVNRKNNYLHRKYRLLGGPGENLSSPNLTDRTKFMILFHLQTLGAGRDVETSLKFRILNFGEILKKKIGKFIDFYHIFILCCVILLELVRYLIKSQSHVLGN